jgi:hypothetical protein
MQEMALAERTTLALDGVVVVAVDVLREGATDMLKGKVRLTVRGMWTDGGRLQRELHKVCDMLNLLEGCGLCIHILGGSER